MHEVLLKIHKMPHFFFKKIVGKTRVVSYSPVFSFSKCFPRFPFKWSRTKEIKSRSRFSLFKFDWTEEGITIHVLNILVLQQCCVKFTLDGCVTLSLLFCCCLFVFVFNPEHLKLSMHIFHTVLYTFPMVLTRRICLKKQELSWWSFPLLSWP